MQSKIYHPPHEDLIYETLCNNYVYSLLVYFLQPKTNIPDVTTQQLRSVCGNTTMCLCYEQITSLFNQIFIYSDLYPIFIRKLNHDYATITSHCVTAHHRSIDRTCAPNSFPNTCRNLFQSSQSSNQLRNQLITVIVDVARCSAREVVFARHVQWPAVGLE